MGWWMSKRRYRPISVERDAALNALGLLGSEINWDHRPPLSHRPRDPATGLYVPDENDPRFLFPVLKQTNQALNRGTHVPLSGDTSIAAKLKRIERKHEESRQRILAKDSVVPAPAPKRRARAIPSRPFAKRKTK